MFNLKKVVAPLAAVATGLFATTGAYAVGTDFSSISSGIDASTIVTAIVAMGAIMILPGVAKWGSKKLATFFG
ncbi:hypothetical protein [Collimonas antrihumi]|uniref:hypothetical protein n=1 Tax=Collimonas antrihumi TaxID=1940615 RepID=UPI001B8D038A|nr:hypothetical protein [Collimonas antrihumi]